MVKNCFGLFATHFHEISRLEDDSPNIGNKHVAVQETHEKITMLYQVDEGDEKRSFGINVAQICKFPSSVVNLAKKRARELENDGEDDEDEEDEPPKKILTKDEMKQQKLLQEKLIKFCRIPFAYLTDEECGERLKEFL